MGHPVVLVLLLIIVLILIVGGILMSIQRKDPLRNCRYRVEIDGMAETRPSQISGIEAAIESIEYREGADPLQVRQLAGLPKYGPLILRYGLTQSKELYDWFKLGVEGKADPRNITILHLIWKELIWSSGGWSMHGLPNTRRLILMARAMKLR